MLKGQESGFKKLDKKLTHLELFLDLKSTLYETR
jgi:hypothetical protein